MRGSRGLEVRLPGGLWLDGDCHRDVSLRPFTGHDEEALATMDAALPAVRVSHLLASCIERIGPVREVTHDLVERLSIGDREALLLHVRRLTLGSRLQCVGRCAACQETVDLSFSVDDLLQAPYEDWQPEYETRWTTPLGDVRVRFRVPTGADQVAAARLAADDLPAAHALLLQRCVVAMDGPANVPVAPDDAEPAILDTLPALIAERDAQAESVLAFTCPACGAEGQALFDAADFLLRELGVSGGDLYRQVHRLAQHYHWSEADILSLPWSKRRRYLELVDEVTA